MLSHIINPSWYKKFKRHREDKFVVEVLEGRIQQWGKNEASHLPVDRIFPIFGYPGVGKSSLLKYFSEQKSVLFDLKECKKYSTPRDFVEACEGKLNKASTYKDKRNLILVDHVPLKPDSDYLDAFEQKILLPNLEKNSFFVMAKQDKHSWCWSTAIPHSETYVLYGFLKDEKDKLINELANGKKVEEQDKRMFETDEIFPKLIQLWGENKAKDACQTTDEFLKYWLGEIESELPIEEIPKALKIAGAMTWLESIIDEDKVKSVATIISEEVTSLMRLRNDLGNRGWTGAFGAWYEPIKTILSIWFQCKHQDLANELNKNFGG